MQVVILAGGLGTRLRPITYQTPKPMVIINSKPFLEYQLKYIKFFGLKNILLLVSYLGNQIEEYFDNGSKIGLNINYSYEKEPLGTGGALKNAENKIENEFLLLNGDTFLPIDINSLIKYFKQNDIIGAITVYNNPDKIFTNNISLDESTFILNYSKKESNNMTHVDAGAIVFKKYVLDLIPENVKCSLEEEIYCKLIKQNKLKAYVTQQRFYDIGSFKELEIAGKVLK